MSALYPAPSPVATAWLTTLRATLAGLADQVRPAPPIDVETLAAALESASPEAAELGGALVVLLEEFETVIGGVAAAFGLVPSTTLIALGRGEEIGEIDPIVAAVVGDGAVLGDGGSAEVRALTSSGTVTIGRDGASTTLIAGTTVAAPIGPVRIPWPDRDDVWLCAVNAEATPVLSARAALERLLPHVGVTRARLRPGATTGPHQALHAALLAIDPAADPDLVMARLEGWRAALEQLHRGAVAVYWEQA